MMTVERFQEEKARLVALYGQGSHAATGQRVQALAKLYAESGWTERALAAIEGMSKSRINQQLIFGRFLLFLPTIGGQDYPYPERTFRVAWGHTDPTQSDTARFQAMLDTMATEQHTPAARPGTPQLPKQIIAQFADGKWHPVATIAEAVGSDIATVRPLLDRIVALGRFQTFAERRPSAKGMCSYRLVKGGKKKIDVTAFAAEVTPLLDEMWQDATGHLVHFSQASVKRQVAQLRQVIARMAR